MPTASQATSILDLEIQAYYFYNLAKLNTPPRPDRVVGAITHSKTQIIPMADSNNSNPPTEPTIYKFVSPKTQGYLRAGAKHRAEQENSQTNNMSTEQT